MLWKHVSTWNRTAQRLAAASALALPLATFAGEVSFFDEDGYSGIQAIVNSPIADTYNQTILQQARSLINSNGHWEICMGPGHSGACQVLGPGRYNLNQLGLVGFRSIREVAAHAPAMQGAQGFRIELYDQPGFRGQAITVGRDVPNLMVANFARRARSAVVVGGTWELCTNEGFRGRCQALPPGRYSDLPYEMQGTGVSLRVLQAAPVAVEPTRPGPATVLPGLVIGGVALPGAVVQAPPPPAPPAPMLNGRIHLFSAPALTGRSMSLTQDMPTFSGTGMNDRTQSIRVESGTWELCEHEGFRGECRLFAPGDYNVLYGTILDRAVSSARLVTPPPVGAIQAGVSDGIYPDAARDTSHAVLLFDFENFRGESYRANLDAGNLGFGTMNDRASSILIRFGRWEFCEHRDMRGRCVTLGPGAYPSLQPELNNSITSFRRVQ